MYSSGMLETGIGVKFNCGMSSAARQKDSLIAIARSSSLKTVPLTAKLVNGGGFESPDNMQLDSVPPLFRIALMHVINFVIVESLACSLAEFYHFTLLR